MGTQISSLLLRLSGLHLLRSQICAKAANLNAMPCCRFWLIAGGILDLGYGCIEDWGFDTTRRKVGVQELIGLK